MYYEGKLEGEKIYLRNIEMKDISDKYLGWLNDPEVNQYLETRFISQSIAVIQEFVAAQINSKDSYLFAVIDKVTGEHVGNVKLGAINKFHLTAEVSLMIGEKKCWGKGFGTEAYRLLVSLAFGTLGLFKCTLGVYKSNAGSLKIAQNAGFQMEGIRKKQVVTADHQRDDVVIFGIINHEFAEKM